MAGASPRTIVAVVVYVALCATLLTDLYDPLTRGTDESWAIFVVLAAAQVGLGAAVRERWVFAAPVILCLAIAATLDGPSIVFVPLLGIPTGLVLVAIGRFLGGAHGRRWAVVTAVALVAALVPVTWAGAEQLKRSDAEHVPESVQIRLPIKIHLANLCDGGFPPKLRADLEQRAEVLIQQLNLDSDRLVTYEYRYTDAPSETRDITVRELAQEESELLNGPGCTELRERIEAAIE